MRQTGMAPNTSSPIYLDCWHKPYVKGPQGDGWPNLITVPAVMWGPWGWSGSSPSSVGISAARLCVGAGAWSHWEAGSERAHCFSLEPGCWGDREGGNHHILSALLPEFCFHSAPARETAHHNRVWEDASGAQRNLCHPGKG